MFNDEVMCMLDENSLVMQSMADIHPELPSFENSFQIIGNKDPNKKLLIVAALQIYILYQEMEHNIFGSKNYDWNFIDISLNDLKNNTNFITEKLRRNFYSNVQSVYGNYKWAFILYKTLIGKYNLKNYQEVDLIPNIKEHIKKDFYIVTIEETNQIYKNVSIHLRTRGEEIKIYNFAYFPPSNFIQINSGNFKDVIYKKKYCVEEL
jgi:hypothetical protein